jgi:hypothetical protein
MKSQSVAVLTTLLVVGTLASIASAAPVTVTLDAVKDNTLFESSSGHLSNGAGEHFFTGRTLQSPGASLRRGLLAFNIAGALPSGAIVEQVSLQLHMSKTISGAQTTTLHRVLADWGEGASNATAQEGSGIAAAAGDATWLHRFFPGQAWSTPGGDFVSNASASLPVNAIGFYTWSSAGMVADVQAWLDAPTANFGWLVRGNEASPGSAKRFDSRQSPITSRRPRLTITYSLPPPSLPGDANLDGVVDRRDLVIVAQNYGTRQGAIKAMGDFDEDGVVGLTDAAIWRNHSTAMLASPAAVPEPAGMLLAAPAIVLLIAYGRRRRADRRQRD